MIKLYRCLLLHFFLFLLPMTGIGISLFKFESLLARKGDLLALYFSITYSSKGLLVEDIPRICPLRAYGQV